MKKNTSIHTKTEVNRLKYVWFIGLIFFALQQQTVHAETLMILHDHRPVVTVNQADFSLPLVGYPFIDIEIYNQLTEELNKHVQEPSQNAKIGEDNQIISEKAGLELNREQFAENFFSFYHGQKSASMELPLRSVHPRVDSELLSIIRTKIIGHYVTYFNSRNKERSHNIALAAKAINNHVVFPGETFSFNKTVGMRTKEKGYLPAPVIVRGELSEGIGGGICQVSSTLYNAADRSGLKILQRYSHSKQVPYVPPGRDATVSWYGPDFTFKNDYNQAILIRATVNPGTMTVMLFSAEDVNVKPRKVPSMRVNEQKETI